MKRMGLSVAIASACAIAAGAAQQKPERPAKNDKTVILTGCLEARDPSAPAEPHASYILVNASASTDETSAAGSPNASSAPRPVVGTSGAKAGAGVDYRLEGMSPDLAARVGKRVEVRGTLEPASGITPRSDERRPAAAGGAPASMPGAQLVHVKEVHTAAGDCAK